MASQECHGEKFTKDDLMHLKIAIALFQSNLQMNGDMPETWATMQPLKRLTGCGEERQRSKWYAISAPRNRNLHLSHLIENHVLLFVVSITNLLRNILFRNNESLLSNKISQCVIGASRDSFE
jgi:hypothetical protein